MTRGNVCVLVCVCVCMLDSVLVPKSKSDYIYCVTLAHVEGVRVCACMWVCPTLAIFQSNFSICLPQAPPVHPAARNF